MKDLEKYFGRFRKNIVGVDHHYETPNGNKKIIYNDWIASGRLYEPLEKKITEVFGPYVANTHTETSETGTLMTESDSCGYLRIGTKAFLTIARWLIHGIGSKTANF